MKAAFVTGSRHYTGLRSVQAAVEGTDLVVHGSARGADSLADRAAREIGVLCLPIQARWDEIGVAAGPERNQRMADFASLLVDQGWDVVCVAFPLRSSVGTWDCVRKMKASGISVFVRDINDL